VQIVAGTALSLAWREMKFYNWRSTLFERVIDQGFDLVDQMPVGEGPLAFLATEADAGFVGDGYGAAQQIRRA
jgi:hypothetical protein